MASNRVIGLNNKMPWHLSADLKKFKEITMSSPIIMGRKTFEAIGKPLPGRCNIIISRNLSYQQDGCRVFHDIKSAIDSCEDCDEVFVIGGSSLYEAILPYADCLYLTEINKEFTGDTYFPKIDFRYWHVMTREDIDNDPDVDFSYSFIKLAKNNEDYAYKDTGC